MHWISTFMVWLCVERGVVTVVDRGMQHICRDAHANRCRIHPSEWSRTLFIFLICHVV